jgi:proteic killer suppression protein
MIKSFKHKGLRDFFQTGNTKGIQGSHTKKLRYLLEILNQVNTITDLYIPGLYLHKLKGDRQDIWSIRVSANWRLTFEFVNGDVYILDYEDYH